MFIDSSGWDSGKYHQSCRASTYDDLDDLECLAEAILDNKYRLISSYRYHQISHRWPLYGINSGKMIRTIWLYRPGSLPKGISDMIVFFLYLGVPRIVLGHIPPARITARLNTARYFEWVRLRLLGSWWLASWTALQIRLLKAWNKCRQTSVFWTRLRCHLFRRFWEDTARSNNK
jgi:hypothetical protein